MVVFAHPDDGELGAGGAVAAWARAGCEITHVVCTDGRSGSNDRAAASDRIVPVRREEQRAAAATAGVRHIEFLDHPDGGLEDNATFRGEIVRMIRRYRPHTVFCHDPYHTRRLQHRDHRMVGTVVLDAVYPYARDHLHFPEQIENEGLEPHKVRRVLMWGSEEPDVIIDTSEAIETQIEALARHESQIGGLRGGSRVFDRIRERSEEAARGHPFRYGQRFRQLIARE